jgi:ElaB/YqjD/DUF883 family membrane-anchored ribosome-binding protein
MAEYEFQELETLKADIAKLRSDLVDLTQKLTDLGKDGAGTAKEELDSKVQNLKERLHQILKDTRKRGKKTAETVQQQIEDRVLISLIAATGVGLLLGIMLSWIIKGRDSD